MEVLTGTCTLCAISTRFKSKRFAITRRVRHRQSLGPGTVAEQSPSRRGPDNRSHFTEVRMIVRRAFIALAVSLVAGCATATTGAKTDSRLLLQDEIQKSGVGGSAYDVLSRLRPAFLVSRGQTTLNGGSGTSSYPNVYLDGIAYGDITTLRNI